MLEHEIDRFIEFVRTIYEEPFVPLHRPLFCGNEKEYLLDCIDSNFVSSVGEMVSEFETSVAEFAGCDHAIAMVNGTAALHAGLVGAGVSAGDEVITQPVTFIATCNAIRYQGANPIFIDVDMDTLGLSPDKLRLWLEENTRPEHGQAINTHTGAAVKACVPMHTFGLPCRIEEIVEVCEEFGLNLIEDAAESLGSYVNDRHTGTFGSCGTFSFNGNKIITTGGGGMVVTDDSDLARRLKHVSTTAKLPHAWEFVHDQVGYNYRMPNLNAALGCAQIEELDKFLLLKSKVARKYEAYFSELDVEFVKPSQGSTSNNWLNAIRLNSREERDVFLKHTNENGVMTRPLWELMPRLEMFAHCQRDSMENASNLFDTIVTVPSGVPMDCNC